MRKLLVLVTSLLIAFIFTSAPASALVDFDNAPSGAHFRKGYDEPVCSSSTVPTTGTITVSCTGTQIAGVGNTNADLLLEIEGTANFVCHNPGNDNIVEPHSDSVSDSVEATLTPTRNGTLVVDPKSVSISPEEAAEQFTCPNPNWREEFTGFSDLSYTYSLTFAGFDDPAILITG